MNKNILATISHNEYKDVLLNKDCIRHSINRIQSKTKEQEHIKSTTFYCINLMTKYMIKTMDIMDQLLVISVNYKKTVILVTI